MSYFATGNGGNGTRIYYFNTKKERDYFVSWNTKYDQRGAVTRREARRYNQDAYLLIDGELVPDGYNPTMIAI